MEKYKNRPYLLILLNIVDDFSKIIFQSQTEYWK